MDGRVSRRAHQGRDLARRQLLPTAGLDVVFPASLSERSAWETAVNGAGLRQVRHDWLPLRRRCELEIVELTSEIGADNAIRCDEAAMMKRIHQRLDDYARRECPLPVATPRGSVLSASIGRGWF